MKKTVFIALVSLLGFSSVIIAQEAKITVPTEGFFTRNDVAYYIKAGKVNPIIGMQELGNGTTVDARGVVKHADGTSFQLKTGELADFTGSLTSTKVNEHIELINGKASLVTNGIVTPIESGLKLSDGSTVDEFGNVSNGITLKTGDKINIDGTPVK